MKKIIIVFILLVSVAVRGCSSLDPPITHQEITDPTEYLNVNSFVKKTRELSFAEGKLTKDFLPDSCENLQVLDYLYWYNCALFGDPNYVITITIFYPTEEDFIASYRNILSKNGTSFGNNNNIIKCTESTIHSIKELIEDPLQDGCMYWLEYAYIDQANRCVTYTEAYLWEGQIHPEIIELQIQEIYELLIAE